MNKYEELLNDADKSNVTVTNQFDLSDTRFKGLYCDGTIAISKNMNAESEKACILAEELGHHYTSSGNIIDMTVATNRKQELHARAWAYNRLIGLYGIINAYRSGCRNGYEIAEHLNITEGFLNEALQYYRNKYGLCTTVDNYVIYFEPALGIFEQI